MFILSHMYVVHVRRTGPTSHMYGVHVRRTSMGVTSYCSGHALFFVGVTADHGVLDNSTSIQESMGGQTGNVSCCINYNNPTSTSTS